MYQLPMHEAWPELQGQSIIEHIYSIYHSGEPCQLYDFELVADWDNNHSSAKRYFDFECTALKDDDGHITGVIIAGLEVTGKAQANRAIAEQQLLYENIINAAGTALWMINAHGEITFVNQAWIDWTGRPLKAHLGRGWIHSVLPDDRYRVIHNYIDKFKNKEPYSVDFRVLRADNELQWVAATGKPRYLTDGTFAGYVGSCMDITERKNAEQAAKDSQERFRLIANTAPVFIWMSSKDHNISFLNRSFMQFLGLTSLQEYPANPIEEHIHPDDRELMIKTYQRSFQLQTEYNIEYRIQAAGGNYRWVTMKGLPRYNENGLFKGYIGSGIDITGMKEHEQVKNDFIGMASHELKTPLTSIKAYVQLLINRHKNFDDEDFTKKSLLTVNKQVGRLTRLVSDLLDISKMDSGRLSLNLDHVVVNDAVKEAIEEVQHTSSTHQINYLDNGLFDVIADKDRIAQVVTNLLTNAIKYSPAASEVDVTVSGNSKEVTIKVRDYGIGISPADQHQVFNRFYRVEGKNEQTFSGFGIGLFIAAEIIKRHKGQIGVASEYGKGTTFYFTLPVTRLES
jgi:PAS domain S-box-containing protein